MEKKAIPQPQDKYILRLPDGMRDRIKKSADRNGRSMNAEIIQALEQYFPEEPTVDEVLDRVHSAIEMAASPTAFPYRKVLIDALDQLSERLSSGLEFDQFQSRTTPPHAVGMDHLLMRMDRWRRAKEVGIEQADLERELSRGLLRNIGGSRASGAIQMFAAGKPDRALRSLRMDTLKFADPEAAHAAIEKDLRAYYEENWGDPDTPWEPDD